MSKPKYNTIYGHYGMGLLYAIETKDYYIAADYLLCGFDFQKTRQSYEYWERVYTYLHQLWRSGGTMRHRDYLEVRAHIIEMMEHIGRL